MYLVMLITNAVNKPARRISYLFFYKIMFHVSVDLSVKVFASRFDIKAVARFTIDCEYSSILIIARNHT